MIDMAMIKFQHKEPTELSVWRVNGRSINDQQPHLGIFCKHCKSMCQAHEGLVLCQPFQSPQRMQVVSATDGIHFILREVLHGTTMDLNGQRCCVSVVQVCTQKRTAALDEREAGRRCQAVTQG